MTSAGRSPWFRALAARPEARLRLVVLPHAGGGPAVYREWVDHLPAGVEPVAVQRPGRALRWKEPAFRRIEPLLAALRPELEPLLDRPVVLFGHSLGALIAFELARAWAAAGRPVGGLVVAGAAAPRI